MSDVAFRSGERIYGRVNTRQLKDGQSGPSDVLVEKVRSPRFPRKLFLLLKPSIKLLGVYAFATNSSCITFVLHNEARSGCSSYRTQSFVILMFMKNFKLAKRWVIIAFSFMGVVLFMLYQI